MTVGANFYKFYSVKFSAATLLYSTVHGRLSFLSHKQ